MTEICDIWFPPAPIMKQVALESITTSCMGYPIPPWLTVTAGPGPSSIWNQKLEIESLELSVTFVMSYQRLVRDGDPGTRGSVVWLGSCVRRVVN